MALNIPKTLPEFFQHATHVVYGLVIALSFQLSNEVVVPVENIVQYPVNTAILVVAYFIIVTSWIGYFKSVRVSPHKEKKAGILRFGVDLFIVYLFYYMISLASPEPEKFVYHNEVIIWVLPVIYATYLLWDILKYIEYKGERAADRKVRRRRIKITIDYLIIFMALSGLFFLSEATKPTDFPAAALAFRDITLLFGAGVFTVLYRRAKWVTSQRARPKRPRKARKKRRP